VTQGAADVQQPMVRFHPCAPILRLHQARSGKGHQRARSAVGHERLLRVEPPRSGVRAGRSRIVKGIVKGFVKGFGCRPRRTIDRV
jgi:hypothetical protein